MNSRNSSDRSPIDLEDRTNQKKALINEAYELRSSEEWGKTHDRLVQLQEEWKEIGWVGPDSENDLWKEFRNYVDEFYRRREIARRQRESEYFKNAQTKHRICNEAVYWANSSDYAQAGREMKRLLEEWKQTGYAGKDQEDNIWSVFNGARQKFYANRQDWWKNNHWKKQALVSRAEGLSHSIDWSAAHNEQKQLMAEWKGIGPAGPDHDNELWSQFIRARQQFFDRSNEHREQQERERQRNLQTKEELTSQARSALYMDPKDGKQRIKELQQEWRTVGHVPRDQQDDLRDRFRAACDAVFAHAAEVARARMENEIRRRYEHIAKIQNQIDNSQDFISRLQSQLYELDSSRRNYYERKDSLESKISEVEGQIREKEGWIADHHRVIDEINSKLR